MGARQGVEDGASKVNFARGTVVVVELNPTIGHEQRHTAVRNCESSGHHRRPAFSTRLGSTDCRHGRRRTSPTRGCPLVRAVLRRSRSPSSITFDQSTKPRVRRVFGELLPEEIAAIDEGLEASSGSAKSTSHRFAASSMNADDALARTNPHAGQACFRKPSNA